MAEALLASLEPTAAETRSVAAWAAATLAACQDGEAADAAHYRAVRAAREGEASSLAAATVTAARNAAPGSTQGSTAELLFEEGRVRVPVPSSCVHGCIEWPAPAERPRFSVDLPLASAGAKEFRMGLSTVPAAPPAGVTGGGPPTRLRSEREALTLVQVLSYGWYRGHAVTKVLLRPVTGRRHQLR